MGRGEEKDYHIALIGRLLCAHSTHWSESFATDAIHEPFPIARLLRVYCVYCIGYASIASIASITPGVSSARIASILRIAPLASFASIARTASIATVVPIPRRASVASIASIASVASAASVACLQHNETVVVQQQLLHRPRPPAAVASHPSHWRHPSHSSCGRT